MTHNVSRISWEVVAAHYVGMPECDVALAQVAVMLARAPKSVEVYKTYNLVKQSVREWDGDVGSGFVYDQMLSFADDVQLSLDASVRVLIYAGDADLMCNWAGNQAWTLVLDWSGKTQFNDAPNRAFVTSEVADAGRVRSFENLAFVRVFNSGHMVPMDQPAVSFEMINKFFHDQDL